MELEKILGAYSKNRGDALTRSKYVLPELIGKVDSLIEAMAVANKKAQKIIGQISANIEAGKNTMKKMGEPLEQIVGACI